MENELLEPLLLLKAAILGVVEGVTEFLPVSSTGHLIVFSELLDFWTRQKRDVFDVVIQIGAISAVIYEYWGKLWSAFLGIFSRNSTGQRFAVSIILSSLPVVVLGLLFGHLIKQYLFNATSVALALIVGGLVILWAERRPHRIVAHTVEEIGYRQAIQIGLLQCLALIPGTSRSGATIIGSLFLGVSRKAAAEYSFFLGIPVLFGASLLDFYKHASVIQPTDLLVFAAGMVTAFISALIVIRAFVKYISSHDFSVFAWYRIIFGLIILAVSYSGLVRW